MTATVQRHGRYTMFETPRETRILSWGSALWFAWVDGEQGERFLGNLAPPQFRPQLRTLSAIGTGIVFLIVGMFLMFALHTKFLGGPASRSTPPALLMGVLLLVAIGIGLLVSAVVSFFVARRLGLDGSRRDGSKKDDAV